MSNDNNIGSPVSWRSEIESDDNNIGSPVSWRSETESDDEEYGSLMEIITNEDLSQFEKEINKNMDEYFLTNMIELSNPQWKEKPTTMIVDMIFEAISTIYTVNDYDSAYDETEKFVHECIEGYIRKSMTPPRSYTMGYKCTINKDNIAIESQIEHLRNAIQPQQRTKEWYEFRHNLLTASDASKVLGSESKKNNLIYEKCQPLSSNDLFNRNDVNVNSPMHWGNKYEPISIMIYENMFRTKIEDFGCIRHSKLTCLGASPDGINIDKENDLYGRMIEVKNIVNREITGIPLEAYWIQMQIQMEVCDLDECDFIETRIKEYDDIEQFYGDDREYSGIILYFVSKMEIGNKPHYVYLPLKREKDYHGINLMIERQVADLSAEYSLYTVLYWYLDEISCVLVKRNKEWFSSMKPLVKSTWETIEKERISGYEHRKPKSRKA